MKTIKDIYSSSKFFEWLYQKSILKKPLHRVKRYYLYFFYKKMAKQQQDDAALRFAGADDDRFAKIRSLKGMYKGKRCFITCTGPSLTIEDLELLKNEYVFGMNSICLIHDKTDWKPDFYGIQDINVYDKINETLLTTDNGQVFAPYYYKVNRGTPEDWVYFHMSGDYHLYDRYYTGKFYSKFSDDCYATVYDGFSITYSIMQIAIYMGFDELYLLGADCNYLGNNQHFIETGHQVKDWDAQTVGARLSASYNEAKKFADAHGIKIINVTRGGLLEVYPREKLEDVLAQNKKNKVSP